LCVGVAGSQLCACAKSEYRTKKVGEEMATIPEDLQNLRDFPQYDATFQDHPQFRRRLEAWADKTKNLGNGLSALADSFDKFHETGMEHYKAATSVISSLQRVAGVCRNDSANTISSHIEQVRLATCSRTYASELPTPCVFPHGHTHTHTRTHTHTHTHTHTLAGYQ
jgi:hypothetical protein